MNLIPYIFNAFMYPFEKLALHKQRTRLISSVHGNVLEFGAGTGTNFNYYNTDLINNLTVMDLKFNKLIDNHDFNDSYDVNYKVGNIEKLPFPDNTFDSIVATLIFCSVDDPEKALSEAYRVLKPNGKIYFIEHVLPERQPYRTLLQKLNSSWKAIGKCNLNRETLKKIKKANFDVSDLEIIGNGIFVFVAGFGTKSYINSTRSI